MILQSDNGKEFRNQVITSLKLLWPDIVLCHGRPRHPQSQGSVERCNADVKRMLATWMRENKTKNWSFGLNFVQLQKNNSYHTGIKSTPFRAVYGVDTPLGVKSNVVPVEELKSKSVADLFKLLGIEGEFFSDQEVELDELPNIFDATEFGEPIEATNEPEVPELTEGDLDRINLLVGIRQAACENQAKQAEVMLTRSKKYMPSCSKGDFVALIVPKVDRGP